MFVDVTRTHRYFKFVSRTFSRLDFSYVLAQYPAENSETLKCSYLDIDCISIFYFRHTILGETHHFDQSCWFESLLQSLLEGALIHLKAVQSHLHDVNQKMGAPFSLQEFVPKNISSNRNQLIATSNKSQSLCSDGVAENSGNNRNGTRAVRQDGKTSNSSHNGHATMDQ